MAFEAAVQQKTNAILLEQMAFTIVYHMLGQEEQQDSIADFIQNLATSVHRSVA